MITRRTLLVSAAAGACALAAPNVLRAAPMKLRLPHTTPDIHPTGFAANTFKKILEAKLPGAIEVQIFPNRQLGGDKELLEQTIAGTQDIAISGGILFPLVTGRPAMDAYQLPFLLNTYEAFEAIAKHDITKKIFADLGSTGIVGLNIFDVGQRHFLSTERKVYKTEDFKGLKVRIVPVPLHKATWEAVGTTPIGLAYSEVYGALQTKVIDAVEINVSSVISENLWESGKYFTLTGHYFWPAVMMANKAALEGYPAEIRQAIIEAAEETVSPTMAYSKKLDMEGRAWIQEKGVKILGELQDLPVMQKKMEPILAEWGKKDPLIAEFIQVAKTLA